MPTDSKSCGLTGWINCPATMCSNRPAIFALAIASALRAAAVAQPPEPMKPFPFMQGAAEEKVWSAVVLASNVPKGARPAAVPPELAPFAQKLSKFFGYDQFEILGSATKAMD